MFADNGLADVQSWLYFPADPLQMDAVIDRIFFERGMRFVFSTRSKVPYILKEDGKTKFFGGGYKFIPGKDEVIIGGKAGYVVSFGDMLYRSYDAVLRCREQGLDVGLVNKPTLNIVDEDVIRKIGNSPFVLVVESLNQKTGVRIMTATLDPRGLTLLRKVGSKFGSWLLERHLTPKYGYMGANKEGMYAVCGVTRVLIRVQDVEACRSRFPTRVWILNVSTSIIVQFHLVTAIVCQPSFLRSTSFRIRSRDHYVVVFLSMS